MYLTTLSHAMSVLHARRWLLGSLLLVALFGLCVWYGTYGVAPGLGAYPTEQVVASAPAAYVGDAVTLSGIVVGTDPVEIRIASGGTRRTLTVTEVDAPVERGDQLQVFGHLVDEGTVRATNAFAVPPGDYLYSYFVSFAAGLWVLARLLTQWRLDSTRGLVRRLDAPTLDGLRRRLGGDDDA
jgi:hypothetical protein